MQINSINSSLNTSKYNNSNNRNINPSFEKVIKVSDIYLDNRAISEGKEFNLMISRAIKFLKKVENQGLDFVKNFWKTADSYDTKNLQRTSSFMVTSQDARALTRASHDIKYKGGDKTEYLEMQDKLIGDSTKRVKKHGVEQEVYIKSHLEKRRGIVIDEVGFKNIGEKLEINNPLDKLKPHKELEDLIPYAKPFDENNPFDAKGQGWFIFR